MWSSVLSFKLSLLKEKESKDHKGNSTSTIKIGRAGRSSGEDSFTSSILLILFNWGLSYPYWLTLTYPLPTLSWPIRWPRVNLNWPILSLWLPLVTLRLCHWGHLTGDRANSSGDTVVHIDVCCPGLRWLDICHIINYRRTNVRSWFLPFDVLEI